MVWQSLRRCAMMLCPMPAGSRIKPCCQKCSYGEMQRWHSSTSTKSPGAAVGDAAAALQIKLLPGTLWMAPCLTTF